MMRTKKKFFCSAMCVFCIIAFITLSINLQKVQAYTGASVISEKTLYNETNTYDISNDCFDGDDFIATYEENLLSDEKFRYELNYDLSQKNNNTVMSYPQITVLTPGLGSDARVWSNAYSVTNTSDTFAYDSDSLISKIDQEVGRANIYWAKMKKTEILVDVTTIEGTINVKRPIYDLKLMDITDQTGIYHGNEINNITDISKHIIVVFAPEDSNG